MGIVPVRGNDRIDTDRTLAAADGVDSTTDLVKRFSEGVRDLVKRDKPDRFLVADPFQRHTGYICA